ncbi:hypothetical protein SBP1_gp015 [Vibrio virus vB_VspP_SBP1]|uniref:Uncharacterized protein n=1 Tax=Vibrio virus vB_VspP_SBP1 TaxID=2500581 RepID=A0A3T0IIE8_9CAUD|nr:hypothetical protein KNU36_gp015 [Vibrio virus vB_VspP_SBP1]AZU99607.1 hypothetical protein SBP1_gp015 [Vibrio virus vB_VspP_SBP1]
MSENQEVKVVRHKHELELDDNVFYSIVWSLVTVFAITLILAITHYNTHSSESIVSMTNNGTPAMEASCAIEGYSDSNCVILNTGNAIKKNSQ